MEASTSAAPSAVGSGSSGEVVRLRRRRLLSEMDAPLSADNNACSVEDVLQLLQLLYAISRDTTSDQSNILGEKSIVFFLFTTNYSSVKNGSLCIVLFV